MNKVTQEASIENFGNIVYSEAIFYKALKAIESNGCELISAEDLAFARMQKEHKHSLSQESSFVKEGILYNYNFEPILLRNSLVVLNPSMAQFVDKKYILEEHFNVNNYLEKLPKKDYLIIQDKNNSIPNKRLGEDERTVWLFGEHAKDYGLFLEDKGLTYTDLKHPNYKYSGPSFANQLWFSDIQHGQTIYGNWDLSYNILSELQGNPRMRGIEHFDKTRMAEKNITQKYTYEQMQHIVKETLNTVGIKGDLEKRIITGLKEEQ